MDEWMLNDLLECSVCLERLDTSSKVLPCQHTFCKKCLLEIVDSHKELRCPECRVLVDVSIDELPPNVLLMRILEGMKNAPKKRVSGSGGAKMSSHGIVAHGAAAVAMQHHGVNQHLSSAQQHQAHLASVQHHHVSSPAHTPSPRSNVEYTSPKQVIVPGQACARAMYSYTSPESGDLSFKKGDLIILKKKVDSNWYHGECNGNRGVFPSVYVEILTPLPSPVPQCKALYDFRMTTDEEEGCLTFNKGEVISVIRRVDENWAEGKLADRIGIFPLAFVELNQVARALMKLSTNSQPGPSRVAPPTPTSEETTPLIPTAEHTVTANATSAPSTVPAAVAPHVLHRLGGSVSSSSQSPSSSTTPNSSSTSCSSPSSTAPSSPASPPPLPVTGTGQQQANQSLQSVQADHPPPPHPRGTSSTSPLAQPVPQQHREKRHSLNLLHAANPTNTHRLSGEITSHSDLVTQQAEHFLASAQNSGRSHRHRRSVSDQPPAPNTTNSTTQVSQSSVQLPALYVAMYPYKPQKADELELKKGALYMVTEKCQDGWFKGSAQGAHKSGVFPGNYVALAKAQAHGTGSVTSGGGPRGGGGGSRSNSHNSAATPSTWSRPFSSNSGSNTQQQSGRQSKSNSNSTGASERPYMDIARSMLAAAQAAVHNVTANQQSSVVHTPNKTVTSHTSQLTPPELPPRAASPATTAAGLNSSGISSSWHAQPSTTTSAGGLEPTVAAQVTPLGRSQSHSMVGVGVSTTVTPPPNVTVMASPSQPRTASDKAKEKKSSGLIRRLTTMKKSKSPPPITYSMDNPVFEDGACINGISPSGVVLAPTSAVLQPTHARSGSCPSQLLQQFPSSDISSSPSDPTPSTRHHHRSHHHTSATVTPSSSLFSSGSQRVKHKERANIVTANPALFSRPTPLGASSSGSSETSANLSAVLSVNHRKSSSLDASAADPGKKSRQLFPAVKERFRCIVPYPPNSEYELALQVGDIIHVHKKRDDGWYKGTQERTGRTGLFPASFVEAL